MRTQQIQGGRGCECGKIEKLPYVGNGLIDRHKIWRDDAK